MASLAYCIEKFGGSLSASDIERIKNYAATQGKDIVGTTEGNQEAIKTYIKDLEVEYNDIVQQIERQLISKPSEEVGVKKTVPEQIAKELGITYKDEVEGLYYFDLDVERGKTTFSTKTLDLEEIRKIVEDKKEAFAGEKVEKAEVTEVEIKALIKKQFKQLAYNPHTESSGMNLENVLKSRGAKIQNRVFVIEGIERLDYIDSKGTEKHAYVRLERYDIDGFVEDSLISIKKIPTKYLDVFFKNAEVEQSALNELTKKERESNKSDVLYWIPKVRERADKINKELMKEYGGDFDKAYKDPRWMLVINLHEQAEKAVKKFELGEDPLSLPAKSRPPKPKAKDNIDNLIESFEATGHVATRYPRKRQISVDGRIMNEKEAIEKMRRVVEALPPKPKKETAPEAATEPIKGEAIPKPTAIPKELEPLAKEARKYKTAKEFEKVINKAIDQSREGKTQESMISGLKIGDAEYSYEIGMTLHKAGYKDIAAFYNEATKKLEKPTGVEAPEGKVFATKAIKPQDTITRADLKSIFAKMKNISTGVDKGGNFFFRPLGKPVITIYEVNEIEGYIDTSSGRIPVGSFLGNKMELKTRGEGPTADVITVWHEFNHFLEDNNIISGNDVKALSEVTAKDLGINVSDVTSHQRGDYVGKVIEDWKTQANTRIKRILRKISNFMDAVWEFVGRTRTAKDVLRDIESGKLLKKPRVSASAIGQLVPAFQQTAPYWYSQVVKAVEQKFPNKMFARSIANWIQKQGGKPVELEWLGLDEWLEGKKVVTKDELSEFLRANQVEVREVEKSEDTGLSIMADTKFAKWQLPGGENYKELLLMLPITAEPISFEDWQKNIQSWDGRVGTRKDYDMFVKRGFLIPESGKFKSPHYDEPNILAHVRFNERTDADGSKVLFLEEVQSDWALKGRQEGYKVSEAGLKKVGIRAITRGKATVFIDNKNWLITEGKVSYIPEFEEIVKPTPKQSELIKRYTEATAPDMPFKENWYQVALKRMLRYSAENGFDKLAWISGEQTADRYDLSKEVDAVKYFRNKNGTYNIFAEKDGKEVIATNQISESKVQDYTGKELAEKIISNTKDEDSYSGLDLKIEAAWAKHLYDKMIPQYLKKFGKKWGAEVGETTLYGAKEVSPEIDESGIDDATISATDVKKYLKDGYSVLATHKIEGHVTIFPEDTINIDDYDPYFFFIKEKYDKAAGITVHSFTITPGMKQSAMREGMPLFQMAGQKAIEETKQFATKPTKDYRAMLRKYQEAGIRKPSFQETLEPVTTEDYISNRKTSRNIKLAAAINIKRVSSEIVGGVDRFLGSISTRLGQVSLKLKAKMRRLDFDINTKYADSVKAVQPLLKKAKKMSRDDFADWDYARKNSDIAKIGELINKYNLQDEYIAYRKTLDSLRKEGIDVGLEIGEIEEYAPRILKDSRGFLTAIGKAEEWPIYSRRLQERAQEIGISVAEMPLDMKADIISNMMLGGWVGLGGIPATKQRKLEKIPAYLNKYYMDSDAALMQHLHSIRKGIEARKFFGAIPERVKEIRKRMYHAQAKIRELNDSLKDKLPEEELEKLRKRRNRYIGLEKQYAAYIQKYALQRDYTENIGAYVIELIAKKEISPQHERMVNDILKARFHEVGTRGVVQAYKNLSYIDTMGSPISALTQIGDMAWAAYEGGFIRALKYGFKSAIGKSRITKEDVGIERIAQEFADAGSLGNAVSWVFKAVGLEKIDSIGKEALLNTALEKYQSKAKKEPLKFKKEIGPIFGIETDSVIDDLVNNEISENVKLLVYSRLLDFQPVALSEMPQGYLDAGNGRLFYMLKTFTIKVFDVYRNEIYYKIKKGNKAEKIQGMKNLVRLSAFFILANAGADELKDWVLGRKTDFSDRMVDNILRLFGVSKFVTWKARTEGVGSALARQVLPPFKFIDSAGKDIITAGDEKGLEVIGSIPVVGKLAYWHIGRGTSKREDLWNRRLRKQKAKLNKIKDGLEKTKNKMEYRRKYRLELRKLRQINELQGQLNGYRKKINRLKSIKETSARKKRIQTLEVRRTELIKKFLNRN